MITLKLSDELLNEMLSQLEKETLIKLVKESNIQSQVYPWGTTILVPGENKK